MTGLDAAERACAVADRSDLGRLIATGPDLLSLLHRLSTADIKDLRPGEGRETVVTSAKGRIVERLFVHHLGDDGVLLVAGPAGGSRVLDHLRRFTFAEDTGLSDVTQATCALALIGPRWTDAARKLGVPPLAPFGVSAIDVSGSRAYAVCSNGYDADGLLVIAPRGDEARIRSALVALAAAEGGGTIDADALEAWRILRGLPAAGHELTEERNPLEAGLHGAVSFTKGCYVGQEVVARLNTYDKVARSLVSLELEPGAPVPAQGAAVVLGGKVIGEVTSASRPPGRRAPVALAYVKSRELPAEPAGLAIDDRGSVHVATLISR